MPRRTNDFQKLIFLVKKTLATDAVVTESKMLTDRDTGEQREVDVVIETTVTGHKTRSVFERYNIVSDGDLRDAARRIDAHCSAAGARQ